MSDKFEKALRGFVKDIKGEIIITEDWCKYPSCSETAFTVSVDTNTSNGEFYVDRSWSGCCLEDACKEALVDIKSRLSSTKKDAGELVHECNRLFSIINSKVAKMLNKEKRKC